jgi:hypothetical protein
MRYYTCESRLLVNDDLSATLFTHAGRFVLPAGHRG